MPSMYEKIMSVPLFIGLSHEQISAFLEKTPITFSQFEKNEIVQEKTDIVNNYSCMVEGELEITHNIGIWQNLTLIETIDKPFTLNAERMFGINRESGVDIRATRRTSIMEFSKEQFLKILKSDNIVMLNYLNQLCLKGQMAAMAFESYPNYLLSDFITQSLLLYTSKLCRQVEFRFDTLDLSFYLNLHQSEVIDWIDVLHKQGKIIRTSDGFIVNDRSTFV